MSKRKGDESGKMKLALVGLGLMLLADIVADLTLFIGEINLVHWCELGVTGLAWILVIIGLLNLRHERKEFARGFIASIIGVLGILAQAFFVYKNISVGLEEGAFMAMKPMFTEYVSDLAMLFVLYMLVRGTGQLLAKGGMMDVAKKSIRKSNLDPIIAMVAMVLIPFGTAFSMPISIIIGAVGIVINAAMRLDMINYINSAIKMEDLD